MITMIATVANRILKSATNPKVLIPSANISARSASPFEPSGPNTSILATETVVHLRQCAVQSNRVNDEVSNSSYSIALHHSRPLAFLGRVRYLMETGFLAKSFKI